MESSIDMFISTCLVGLIASIFDASSMVCCDSSCSWRLERSKGSITDVLMEFFITDIQAVLIRVEFLSNHGNG